MATISTVVTSACFPSHIGIHIEFCIGMGIYHMSSHNATVTSISCETLLYTVNYDTNRVLKRLHKSSDSDVYLMEQSMPFC